MKKLFTTLLIGSLLISCGGSKSELDKLEDSAKNLEKDGETGSALEYNDGLVGLQTRIATHFIEMGNTEDPDIFDSLRIVAVGTAKDCIESLDKIKPYPGGENMKSTLGDLMKFYKGILENEYAEMVSILKHDEISEADVTRMEEISASISERESDLDNKFQSAQEKFARDNGFEIGSNPLQGEIDKLNE